MVAAIAVPAHAAGVSREAREKAEVRAIFAMLLARMEPGDGMGRAPAVCLPDRMGRVRPREGLYCAHDPPSAIAQPEAGAGPEGTASPVEFCDYAVRNAQAKQMAKNLSGDRTRIVTADMDFSYPIFSRNFTHAMSAAYGRQRQLSRGTAERISSPHGATSIW